MGHSLRGRLRHIWAVAPQPPEQPDQQPSDNPLQSQEKPQGLGGLGGLGRCFRYPAGDAPEDKETAPEGPTVTVGNKQPEQPESAFLANGANRLDSGGLSGHCSTNGQQQPEQPDLDIPPFLRRPEAPPSNADDLRHLTASAKSDLPVCGHCGAPATADAPVLPCAPSTARNSCSTAPAGLTG